MPVDQHFRDQVFRRFRRIFNSDGSAEGWRNNPEIQNLEQYERKLLGWWNLPEPAQPTQPVDVPELLSAWDKICGKTLAGLEAHLEHAESLGDWEEVEETRRLIERYKQ